MLLEEFVLKDKVAVIVGGNRSWTKEFTKALAQGGADVVAVGSDVSDMAGVMEEVHRLGCRGVALNTDITELENVQSTVQMIISKFKKIDILINNVAIEFVKPFACTTESEWKNILNNSLVAVMQWCQVVGKHMLDRKAGRIINIISALSVRGLSNNTVYCASMGAIHQFTKALALEWARQNIRVTAIAHGWMSGGENKEQPMSDTLVRYIPLRRLGKSTDLTGVVVFLSSDASDYITGETVFVEGGLISHG
jgi:NAD(P)-dependent dehydrogenase (short-subunit alcohol dehydrogenase family)